jgi:hypothetical protein
MHANVESQVATCKVVDAWSLLAKQCYLLNLQISMGNPKKTKRERQQQPAGTDGCCCIAKIL